MTHLPVKLLFVSSYDLFGAWSAPSAIGTAGLGVGGQAGAEMTDFLVVLNSRSVGTYFFASGIFTNVLRINRLSYVSMGSVYP